MLCNVLGKVEYFDNVLITSEYPDIHIYLIRIAEVLGIDLR